MPITDALEKLGRAIFETPFNASRLAAETPELAEIRLAVIDKIKALSHRVGGARVFAGNIVRVHLRGIPEAQREAFQGAFLTDYLSQEIRAALARSSFRFPEDLELELIPVAELPAAGEDWITVETETRAAAVESTSLQPAHLVVVQGTANQSELLLDKPRIHIGRTIDVFRAEGPSRRNDLAFSEENEINRSVSREHAHILQKKRGEYRIFNDRWYKTGAQAEANCGLWIVRDGLSQPVHRNTRGVVLHHGDEIHLGQAIVKFVRSE